MSSESLERLIGNAGPERIIHWMDFLLENGDKSGRIKRFDSSFKIFNEKIGGLQTGQVVVISGRKKNGKTLFAESWMRSMLKKNVGMRSVVFSYEVQTEKLLLKYTDEPTLEIYVPKILKTMDFDWLADRCLEAKLKYDCQLVLIDHLHFMVDMNTKQNMSLNIGAFMRRLKQDIAIGMNLCVILIAHQSMAGKEDASADTIRDSTFVAQEADSVVIVTREKNLNDTDLRELESKGANPFFIEEMYGLKDDEDKYSAGLASVKIDCCRETGVFDFRKRFRKVGNFLEEV